MNDYVQVFSFMDSNGSRYDIVGTVVEDNGYEIDVLVFDDANFDKKLVETLFEEENDLEYYRFLIDEVVMHSDKIFFKGIIASNLDYCMSRDSFYFFMEDEEDFWEVEFSLSIIDYDINPKFFQYYTKAQMIKVLPSVLEEHGIIPRFRLYEYNHINKKLELKSCRF